MANMNLTFRSMKITTQSSYLSEKTIIEALSHKSVKSWVYIKHDKDKYTQEDLDEYVTKVRKAREKDEEYKGVEITKEMIGTNKPTHWHIGLDFETAYSVDSVAKWFDIPQNLIQQIKANKNGTRWGAFLDYVEYLTHEDVKQQALGKHLYGDEDIKASFDWRKALEEREAERQLHGGINLNETDSINFDIVYNGMTIKECIDKNPIYYMKNIDNVKRARLDYIRRLDPPKDRTNLYIYGEGGRGKGLMSQAIARSMFPDIVEDDEIFFTVGAENTTFEGYDGQPVIIWSDMRAYTLMQRLGGRENVFNVFDPHPVRQRQNVKYGSINLCNTVNIVNSPEDYITFLDGLVGEYKGRDGVEHKVENKAQSYRRFPFILSLEDETFDFIVNQGFADNDDSRLQEFYYYNGIRGNMHKLINMCGDNMDKYKTYSIKIIKGIIDKITEILENQKLNEVDDETFDKMFNEEGWGQLTQLTIGSDFRPLTKREIMECPFSA